MEQFLMNCVFVIAVVRLQVLLVVRGGGTKVIKLIVVTKNSSELAKTSLGL
jgi:hypothetical protein